MTQDLADFLLGVADRAGLEASPYSGTYSGRFMCGERTSALVLPTTREIDNLKLEAAADDPKRLPELKNLRSDSLGKDIILY